MRMRMVLASHNRHKAEELDPAAAGFEIEPYTGELPPETGSTFRENALIKAQHVHAAIGSTWVLADDSGITAVALGGAPGIYSARYAGEGADRRRQNLAKLLAAVGRRPRPRRAYVAELVAIDPEGRELHARGELRGTLAREPRGSTADSATTPRSSPRARRAPSPRCRPPRRTPISHRAARAAARCARVLAGGLYGRQARPTGLGADGHRGLRAGRWARPTREPPVDLGADHDDVRHR